VFEFTGHKESDKAFVAVTVSRDPALAAQFPEAAAEKPAADAKPAPLPAPVPAPAAAKPADHSVERLAARTKGLEYEVPLYKYESIFKPLEDLLEKKPEPPAKAAKPVKPGK